MYTCFQYSYSSESGGETYAQLRDLYYTQLRDFFVNKVGLPLIDEYENLSYGNGYDYQAFVVEMTGEKDNQMPIYLNIRVTNLRNDTNQLEDQLGWYLQSASLAWDSVAHMRDGLYIEPWDYNLRTAPTTDHTSVSSYTPTSGHRPHVIYASKDFVKVAKNTNYLSSSDNYKVWDGTDLDIELLEVYFLFGHIGADAPNIHTAELTAPVMSGYGVSVEVDSTTGFAGNDVVYLMDTHKAYAQVIIESVPDATHLILGDVPEGFGIGAVVGHLPSSFVTHASDGGSTVRIRAITGPLSAGDNIPYLSDSNYEPDLPYKALSELSTDSYYGVRGSQFATVAVAAYGPSTGAKRMVIGPPVGMLAANWLCDVFNNNTARVYPYEPNPADVIRGITENTAQNSITDSFLAVSADALIGKVVAIKTGEFGGIPTWQTRVITANTSSSITVGQPFVYDIPAGAEYFIASRVYRSVGPRTLVEERIEGPS